MGDVIRLDAVRGLKRSNEIGVGKINSARFGSGDQVRPSVRRNPDSSPPLQDGMNRNIGVFGHSLHGGPTMGDGCVSHDQAIKHLSHRVNKTFIAGGAKVIGMTSDITPGMRFRLEREHLGVSPEAAAERLGMTVANLRHWENGTTPMTVERADKLGRIINRTAEWVMTGKELPATPLTDREIALVMAYREAQEFDRIAAERVLAKSPYVPLMLPAPTAPAATESPKARVG